MSNKNTEQQQPFRWLTSTQRLEIAKSVGEIIYRKIEEQGVLPSELEINRITNLISASLLDPEHLDDPIPWN
ncbi:hypothetical protein SIN34_002150 [Yersinia enterocolitica]|nr:hypothetical protein [Yersinia enterocolitica]ELW8946914.1 hypothetical protein [Yersinia enterocolitica]